MSFTMDSILSEKTFNTPFYSVEDMEVSPGKEEAASNPPQETPPLDLLSPDIIKTLQAIKEVSFKAISKGVGWSAWKSSTAESLQFDFKPAPINNSDQKFAKIRTYLEKIQASIAGSLDMIKNNGKGSRRRKDFIVIAVSSTGVRFMAKENAPLLTFILPSDLKDIECFEKISWQLKQVVIETDEKGTPIKEQEHIIGNKRITIEWSTEGNNERGTSSTTIPFQKYAFYIPTTIVPSRLVLEARYRDSDELIGEFVSRQLVSFISKPPINLNKNQPTYDDSVNAGSVELEQNPTPQKKMKKNLVPETLKNELVANEIPTSSAIPVHQEKKPKEIQQKEKPKIASVDKIIEFLNDPNRTPEELRYVLDKINKRADILLKPNDLPESQPMETEPTQLNS